ncbi:hypothetical protein EF888_02975 [Silicimonas algicola]|nr:hypothetical protein EF888_02975 [Silicimonas algicola]
MAPTPKAVINPRDFLQAYSGTYQYRQRVRVVLAVFGLVTALWFVLAALKVFALGEPSDLKTSLAMLLSPWAVWASLSSALRFERLEISEEGIKVDPIGLHIGPEKIEAISFKENKWGARSIELRLVAHSWILHIFVCSYGKKAWISFNDRLLLPKDGA